MAEHALDASDRNHDAYGILICVAAFVGGGIVFFTASAIFISFGGTPPSSTPVATVVGHMGWFVGVACVAIGSLALVLSVDSLKTGITGYLAVGALGLGTLVGLQWATWAWVDVLAAQHTQYNLVLETLISSFGSGLSVMYGLLVGGGIAFLGRGILRTQLIHRFVGWAGIAIGAIGVLGNGSVLASAGKNVLFAGMVLVHPLFYLWILVFAIDMYRRQ